MGVNGAERIIQEIDLQQMSKLSFLQMVEQHVLEKASAYVRIEINCASQCNSKLLPTAQIDALFSDFSLVAFTQNFQIGDQGTRLQDPLVFLLIVRLSEQNIVAKSHVLDPCLLGYIRHRPPNCHVTGDALHQTENGGQK